MHRHAPVHLQAAICTVPVVVPVGSAMLAPGTSGVSPPGTVGTSRSYMVACHTPLLPFKLHLADQAIDKMVEWMSWQEVTDSGTS